MSVKKRLQEKSGDLGQAIGIEPPKASPKTAPGQMLAFRGQMIESSKKVAQLEERLKDYEGGTVTRLLDPKTIVPAKWANRSEWSFHDREFEHLKQAIQQSGGNVQPIKVRPASRDGEFEIVFGRRRHRACLDLGIPVLAMITAMSDMALFSEMDQENRERKELSPWEQGTMYRMALAEGLWASQRQMAEGLGVTQALISSAISVADLPEEIVAAFPSPNDIQYRWAKELQGALAKDREATLLRAKAAKDRGGLKARDILRGVVGEEARTDAASRSADRVVKVVQTDNGLLIECLGEQLSSELQKELQAVVEGYLRTLHRDNKARS